MKDFSFSEVFRLMRKTAPLLLSRFLICVGISLGFVLITGTGAGLGYGVGYIGDNAPAALLVSLYPGTAGPLTLVVALVFAWGVKQTVIRDENEGGYGELTNIREGRQPASLFVTPPGYRQIEVSDFDLLPDSAFGRL